MSSLYNFCNDLVLLNFSWLYLLFNETVAALLFYPVGILLSLFILAWILYMVISCSKILIFYFKMFSYTFKINNFQITSQIFYLLKSLNFFVNFIYNLMYFFSTYTFIFYLKRVEFYIFWFFIFCLFIE